MNLIKYKTKTLLLLFVLCLQMLSAQKFKEAFKQEITVNKNAEVSLVANYADIEIIEWNKKKISVEAVMEVEGVPKESAESHFDNWRIEVKEKNDKVKIISKSNHAFPGFDYYNDFDFEPIVFEMPEISIESLGILDSLSYSLPEITFPKGTISYFEIDNDSIFSNFNFANNSLIIHLDSLKNGKDFSHILDSFDFDNMKKTQEYLKKWQEKNKDYFIELQKRAEILAKKNATYYEKEIKKQKLRQKLAKNREKMAKKHAENSLKHQKKRVELLKKIKSRKEDRDKQREKIKHILKNRKKAKVRTKLTIKVPKGTVIEMNVNYSTVRYK
jgi:hypothetical protein